MKESGMKILIKTLLTILILTFPYKAFADCEFTFLNDFFAPNGQDRWLTNDVRAGCGNWLIGSEMYTPTDKSLEEIQENDRNWDGYTYIQYKHEMPIELGESRILLARFGGLGDYSKAERMQKFIHNDLGRGVPPQGWENQNDPEVAIDIIYKQVSEGYLDTFIGKARRKTNYGFRAGNVKIESFIEQYIYRELGSNIEFYSGIGGRAVYFNTFLDGRMFSDNIHIVDKQPFVANFIAGIVIKYNAFEVDYNFQYQTEEFKRQEARHEFGELTLRYKF